MTATRRIQSSFSAGELSPLLRGQTEFQRYQSGVRTMKGFLPLPGGGFTRAPGTIYRGVTRDNRPARLLAFEFSEEDALQLEFTEGYMRVWSYGALVLDGGVTPYELEIPWDSIDEIEDLAFEQTADVIYVASGVRKVKAISRYELDDWSIASVDFATGPFLPGNLERGRRVQCSATDGTIEITMSHSGLIDAANAGALLRIQVTDFENIPLWTANTDVAEGDKMVYNDRIYEVADGTNTGTNPPVHKDGTRLVASTGIKWTYLSESYGVVRLETLDGTGFVWTAEVLDTVPEACVTNSTYRYAVGAWSSLRGYPRALAVFDQRLFAAGTRKDPRTIWFSVVGDLEDFEDGSDADLGGAYTISSGANNTLNQIRWLQEGVDGLYVGTYGDVRRVHPSDAAAAIGPTNIRVSMSAAIGVSKASPILPWTFPVLIDKSGKRLFELRNDENGLGLPLEISLPASHIAAQGMSEVAWQSAPTGTAWIVRKDVRGLAALVYLPAQEMLGWAQVPIAGGIVESICVTPAANGGRDIVTMVVKRKIGGVWRYFVEELADNQPMLESASDDYEANHLYCSIEVEADPPTDTFTVSHLAGETVYAWTDQGSLGPATVNGSGSVTFSAKVSHAVIGLFDDEHEVETLRGAQEAAEGSSMGRKQRLHPKTGVILHRTGGGTVEAVSRDFGAPERSSSPEPLLPEVALAQDLELFTGVRRLSTAAGMSDEVSLRFRPAGGAPMTILGIAPTIEEAGA